MMKGKQLENSAMVGIWLLWIGTKGILIESWNSLAPKGLLEVILLYPTRPHPPAMSGDIFSEQRSGPFTFHAHQHKHAANLLYLFPFVTVSTAQPLALQICGVERTLCMPGRGSAAAARLRTPPLPSGWQPELPTLTRSPAVSLEASSGLRLRAALRRSRYPRRSRTHSSARELQPTPGHGTSPRQAALRFLTARSALRFPERRLQTLLRSSSPGDASSRRGSPSPQTQSGAKQRW